MVVVVCDVAGVVVDFVVAGAAAFDVVVVDEVVVGLAASVVVVVG